MSRKILTVIDGSITFSLSEQNGLRAGACKTFVDIIATEDASAGQYRVLVATTKDSILKQIQDEAGSEQGLIDATKTGPGTTEGDGEGVGFLGPAQEIKIVAIGVVGQTTVEVNINQWCS